MRLNLGSGNTRFHAYIGEDADWIEIDANISSFTGQTNVRKLRYADETADVIYASHLLEYFDREEVVDILSEWIRVLKTGGLLKVAVPDLEAMTKLYKNGDFVLDDFLGPLYGKIKIKDQHGCGVIAKDDLTIYHKTVYDERSLSKLLHKVGFTKIERIWTGFPEPTYNGKYDQSWSYLPDRNYSQGTLISLNLIATK